MKPKMFSKRLTRLLLATMFAAVFFEACSNKGCTDKKAINYNVTADKDDHSCKYCDSTLTQTGQDSVLLIDNNFSSSHYLQAVAKFIVTQKSLKHNFLSCGNDKCSLYYTIENLSNQDFDLDYFLTGSSNTFFNTGGFITVASNHASNSIEIPQSEISNPCGELVSGTMQVSANSIVYH